MSEARRQELLSWLLAPNLPSEANIPQISKDNRSLDKRAWVLGELIALGDPPIETWEPKSMRERYLAGAGALEQYPSEQEVSKQNLSIQGPGGPLAMRLYRSSQAQTQQACILYLHGGGMVIGNLDSHDGLCARLCKESQVAVMALDYRLAPEHPFPAALEDTEAAWFWLSQQASTLGLDPNNLALAGDSAGGNLAAALTQLLVAKSAPLPKAQVLIYPWVDLSLDWPSFESMEPGPVLSAAAIIWFRQQYLQDSNLSLNDPRISPLHADNCSQEPPTYLLTCGFDPLRDMGQAYAQSRSEAGVKIKYIEYPGQIHAFLQAPKVFSDAQNALTDIAQWLKEQL
jgi:acetyl esterase